MFSQTVNTSPLKLYRPRAAPQSKFRPSHSSSHGQLLDRNHRRLGVIFHMHRFCVFIHNPLHPRLCHNLKSTKVCQFRKYFTCICPAGSQRLRHRCFPLSPVCKPNHPLSGVQTKSHPLVCVPFHSHKSECKEVFGALKEKRM